MSDVLIKAINKYRDKRKTEMDDDEFDEIEFKAEVLDLFYDFEDMKERYPNGAPEEKKDFIMVADVLSKQIFCFKGINGKDAKGFYVIDNPHGNIEGSYDKSRPYKETFFEEYKNATYFTPATQSNEDYYDKIMMGYSNSLDDMDWVLEGEAQGVFFALADFVCTGASSYMEAKGKINEGLDLSLGSIFKDVMIPDVKSFFMGTGVVDMGIAIADQSENKNVKKASSLVKLGMTAYKDLQGKKILTAGKKYADDMTYIKDTEKISGNMKDAMSSKGFDKKGYKIKDKDLNRFKINNDGTVNIPSRRKGQNHQSYRDMVSTAKEHNEAVKNKKNINKKYSKENVKNKLKEKWEQKSLKGMGKQVGKAAFEFVGNYVAVWGAAVSEVSHYEEFRPKEFRKLLGKQEEIDGKIAKFRSEVLKIARINMVCAKMMGKLMTIGWLCLASTFVPVQALGAIMLLTAQALTGGIKNAFLEMQDGGEWNQILKYFGNGVISALKSYAHTIGKSEMYLKMEIKYTSYQPKVNNFKYIIQKKQIKGPGAMRGLISFMIENGVDTAFYQMNESHITKAVTQKNILYTDKVNGFLEKATNNFGENLTKNLVVKDVEAKTQLREKNMFIGPANAVLEFYNVSKESGFDDGFRVYIADKQEEEEKIFLKVFKKFFDGEDVFSSLIATKGYDEIEENESDYRDKIFEGNTFESFISGEDFKPTERMRHYFTIFTHDTTKKEKNNFLTNYVTNVYDNKYKNYDLALKKAEKVFGEEFYNMITSGLKIRITDSMARDDKEDIIYFYPFKSVEYYCKTYGFNFEKVFKSDYKNILRLRWNRPLLIKGFRTRECNSKKIKYWFLKEHTNFSMKKLVSGDFLGPEFSYSIEETTWFMGEELDDLEEDYNEYFKSLTKKNDTYTIDFKYYLAGYFKYKKKYEKSNIEIDYNDNDVETFVKLDKRKYIKFFGEILGRNIKNNLEIESYTTNNDLTGISFHKRFYCFSQEDMRYEVNEYGLLDDIGKLTISKRNEDSREIMKLKIPDFENGDFNIVLPITNLINSINRDKFESNEIINLICDGTYLKDIQKKRVKYLENVSKYNIIVINDKRLKGGQEIRKNFYKCKDFRYIITENNDLIVKELKGKRTLLAIKGFQNGDFGIFLGKYHILYGQKKATENNYVSMYDLSSGAKDWILSNGNGVLISNLGQQLGIEIENIDEDIYIENEFRYEFYDKDLLIYKGKERAFICIIENFVNGNYNLWLANPSPYKIESGNTIWDVAINEKCTVEQILKLKENAWLKDRISNDGTKILIFPGDEIYFPLEDDEENQNILNYTLNFNEFMIGRNYNINN